MKKTTRKYWTREEVLSFFWYRDRGYTYKSISSKIGRTPAAVQKIAWLINKLSRLSNSQQSAFIKKYLRASILLSILEEYTKDMELTNFEPLDKTKNQPPKSEVSIIAKSILNDSKSPTVESISAIVKLQQQLDELELQVVKVIVEEVEKRKEKVEAEVEQKYRDRIRELEAVVDVAKKSNLADALRNAWSNLK